ncbi:MAG: hypothetical protein COC19_04685 [SAR86 cluster bacterium]|uniref:ABM domain-containing protein n=1 Tax=SAR86 cluster bacterium TaxID=2030880 RepID=A0A2A4MNN0_9GAMM|nr:MAG: hypothetical protein COC19_04685 [SAR86 cluster bacterium]
MIMVQSTFQLIPEKKTDLLAIVTTMIEASRQESGCISYEFYEGLSDSNQLVLLQEWKSPQHLQGHYQTTHMEEFLSKLGDYLLSPVTSRSYISEDEKKPAPIRKRHTPASKQTLH